MWNIIVVLSAISFATDFTTAQLRPPPKVQLPSDGVLIGSYMFSSNRKVIDAFRGIPYAKPPVGDLRFAAPVPFPPWSGDRVADHDGQPCPQQDAFGYDKTYFGSEDCLYLNVYTPHKRYPNGTLSVMVFFHGGAFLYGGSSSEIYGPQRLLDNNIVLVTSNYRLGPLGFLSTGTMDSPGNFGLKDQVLVLKWVKDNIQAFGGNPEDVTIFGHSAGAASVAYHMVSPLSEGLFHKAIMQSGNSFDPWAKISMFMAVGRARRIGDLLNCTDNEDVENMTTVVNCLRGKTVQEILITSEEFYIIDNEPMNIFGPIIEPKQFPGAFLTEDPRSIKNSHGTDIPVIIGVTSDDGLFKSAPIIFNYKDEFRESFAELLPFMLMYGDIPVSMQDGITKEIDKFYFKNDYNWTRKKHQNLTNMFSDRLFYSGMDEFIQHRLANSASNSTYVYLFDHKGPKSLTELYGGGPSYYGVAHGDELPFIFPLAQEYLRGKKNDERMQWGMPKLWTDFAKTGNPTPPKSPLKRWIPASKYPLNFARLGNRYKKSSNYQSVIAVSTTPNTIITEKLNKLREPIKNQMSSVVMSKSNDIGTMPNFSKRLITVGKRAKNSPMWKPLQHRRRSRKHGNKKKSSKKSKNYYPVVGNEVGLAEERLQFWRSIQTIVKKGEEMMQLEVE